MSIRARVFLLVCLAAASALAQNTATPPAVPTAQSSARVIAARGSNDDGSAGLGDRLTVTVKNFDQLLTQVSGNCRALVLYLDEAPLTGMPPEACDAVEGEVTFILDRNADDDRNDNAWHRLLGSPKGFLRPMRVSIGPNDQFFVPTTVTEFNLFLMPEGLFYVFMISLLAALVLFVTLCRRTSIIRAPLPPPGGGEPPYSLSRFQLAFWFFLVVSGYVFVWIITGELDTITASILALIGIGSGTALGAALIDTPGSTKTQTTAEAATPPPPPPPARASQGFIPDLLGDSTGAMSIHRFQMFIWTIVLGIIFVASVYHELSMPEFSTTLLGLMGISSGTYLGFKFPERTNQQVTAASPNEPTKQ